MTRIFSDDPGRLFAAPPAPRPRSRPRLRTAQQLSQTDFDAALQYMRETGSSDFDDALVRYQLEGPAVGSGDATLSRGEPDGAGFFGKPAQVISSHSLVDAPRTSKRLTDEEMDRIKRYATRKFVGWDEAAETVLGFERWKEACTADLAYTEYTSNSISNQSPGSF